MAKIGVMLTIPDESLDYLNSKNLSDVFRAAAAQVQKGNLDGDWTHSATQLDFQIRSVGIVIK